MPLQGFSVRLGAVAEVVEIRGGVISGLCNDPELGGETPREITPWRSIATTPPEPPEFLALAGSIRSRRPFGIGFVGSSRSLLMRNWTRSWSVALSPLEVAKSSFGPVTISVPRARLNDTDGVRLTSILADYPQARGDDDPHLCGPGDRSMKGCQFSHVGKTERKSGLYPAIARSGRPHAASSSNQWSSECSLPSITGSPPCQVVTTYM